MYQNAFACGKELTFLTEIQRQERMDRLEQRVLFQSLQNDVINGARQQPQVDTLK